MCKATGASCQESGVREAAANLHIGSSRDWARTDGIQNNEGWDSDVTADSWLLAPDYQERKNPGTDADSGVRARGEEHGRD